MMFCSRHDAAPSPRQHRPFHSSSSRPTVHRRHKVRPLQIESLEPRLAMAAEVGLDLDAALTHGGVCACPICSGQGLEQLLAPQGAETVAAATTAASSTASLASVPQLSSNPAARVKLYLDFNGHVQGTWGSWSNVRTPAFDQDGNPSSFSSTELAAIREIWTRVAEDYAPFQIDVTTIEPASFADRAAVRVAIGGNWSDWFGSSAGGVAYVGGFTTAAPNVAFVFSKALGNGNARYVAEAAAHEAGHLFGLSHQSTYAGSALAQSYNSGTSTLAPIMGVGYYASRTTWHHGPTDSGPAAMQDDVSILASAANGFGLRPDDYGSTIATASNLPITSGNVSLKGIIGDYRDEDVWKFTTGGGTVRFSLNVASHGANLDSVLELKNAAGQVLVSSSPTTSLGASLAKALTAGTYYVVARSSGGHGNMGQYTLTGSVPAASSTSNPAPTQGAPEITVSVGSSQVADGGQISFGTTSVGARIDRTITISNHGTANLTLSRLGSVPAGFSIVTNVGLTSLAPGQSTSFTIRLNAAAAGTYAGRIVLANNDSNEGQYDLNLSGSVRSAATTTTTSTSTSTTRILDNGQAGYAVNGSWSTRTGSGRDGDLQSAARSTSGVTATANWSFTSLPAGSYRVWMTWPGGTGQASNAPVSFYDGSRLVRTVTVDQRSAASGLSKDGSNWKLITTLTISGSQMAVNLGNNANGTVIADALRIERVTSAADLPAFAPSAAADENAAALLLTATNPHPRLPTGDDSSTSKREHSAASAVDVALSDLAFLRGAVLAERTGGEILVLPDESEEDEYTRSDEIFTGTDEGAWLDQVALLCRT